jgi:hypothetical protein
MPKLTIRKTDCLDDWYLIELADHDGREWLEPVGMGLAFRRSARFSDADVEGDGREMLALAAAIERNGDARFKRCAVDAWGSTVEMWSPRNSSERGTCTREEALELAQQIRAMCAPTPKETP